MTRVRFALVDVHLAAGSRKPAGAVAPEGPGSVDAQTLVLAGVALGALVHVFGAVGALKAVGTRADVGAVDGTGVADGALVARVARAGVVQVAQQTWKNGEALLSSSRELYRAEFRQAYRRAFRMSDPSS